MALANLHVVEAKVDGLLAYGKERIADVAKIADRERDGRVGRRGTKAV